MSKPTFNPKASSKVDFQNTFGLNTLRGQNALITGGASGMGAAFAIALAENGCLVTIVDLNNELGEAVAKEQQERGLDIHFVCADVTSYASLLQAFKTAVNNSPTRTLDIMIPSAGLFGPPIHAQLPYPSSSEDPPAPSTAVLEVNFTGVYLSTYLALHYFRQNSTASSTTTKQILFISSLLAYIEAPLNLSYCSSKHAVRGLFRSLRWESEALGIGSKFRTNLIAPTLVKTPMTRDFWKYLQEEKGFELSEVGEVVDVGLRCLCDGSVDGRAVAVVPGSEPVDLCDDFEGADGGRECLGLVERGVLGKGPSELGRFAM